MGNKRKSCSTFLLKETDEREKSILQWDLISNENKALLAKQIQHDSIAISKEELIKYCGEYNPSDPNASTTTLFIVLNGNHICRHLSPGTGDVRLIPLSDSKFICDDDSGRTIDFVKDKNGVVLSMILSSQEEAFTKNKKNSKAVTLGPHHPVHRGSMQKPVQAGSSIVQD